MTLVLFFFASFLIRLYINEDWTGEPPGEFIIIATAAEFFILNAFSSKSSIEDIVIPFLSPPIFPIIPEI